MSSNTSGFSVYCSAKSRHPQCDQDKAIVDDRAENPQATMYVSVVDASATLGAATAAFEIGDNSAGSLDAATLALSNATGSTVLVGTVPTAVAGGGNGAVPALPTSNNNRRIRVPRSGVYHYDIDLIYTLGAAPDGSEILRTGPTVLGANGTLTFQTGNQYSLAQTYGTEPGAPPTRQLHVSGNLILSAGDEVGIFRHTVDAGNSTTFLAAQARLQLIRVSA